MFWLLAASAALVCFCTAALGTFVPLRDSSGFLYLFAAPDIVTVGAISAAAVIALVVLFVATLEAVKRQAPHQLALARSGRWLAPISALAVVPLGILPAVPGVGEYGAPIGYFLYDLRWWWLAVLALSVAGRLDGLLGEPIARRCRSVATWPSASRLLLIDTVLFTVVVAWALVSTPWGWIYSPLHGDEPKYVRYCEVWYQGGGLEIKGKVSFTDLPLDAPPRILEIPRLLAVSLIEESRALAADLRQFAAHPVGFQWNRAIGGDGGFLTGKHGGTYQMYQPGLSAVLFPGYFVDRYLLGLQPGYNSEFPLEHPMTNLMLVLIYGACGVALFRLLRHALSADGPACVWAAIAMLTLPTKAFVFQFYPELPALFAIILVCTYVMFHAPDASALSGGSAGAAAAALAWFHPRFLLVSLLLAVAGVVRTGANGRRAFVACFAVTFLSVLTFSYRVTGSWLPSALFDVSGPEVLFNPWGVPSNLLAYALHRDWGLAPHAPWLIGVLPGIVLLGRDSVRRAALLSAVGLALAIPAAGHTLSAAGGTPGRLVMAIVPLFAWPMALLVRRFWASAAFRTATVVAVVLSLDAALAYNWNEPKTIGTIVTAGLSGWRPNLAFPLIREEGWTSSTKLALALGWVVLIVGASLFAFLRSSPAGRVRAYQPRSWLASTVVVGLFIGLSGAGTAAMGDWHHPRYLIEDAPARRLAARGLLASERCRVCFTSRERAIDWRVLEPNPAHGMEVETAVNGSTVTITVRLNGDDRSRGFGRIRMDFGDQSGTEWTGIVGEHRVVHTYHRAGEYALSVWLRLRDHAVHGDRRTLEVGGSR